MDNIKFDIEKEKELGIPIPDIITDTFKSMPKFVVGIIANSTTLTYTNLIKKRLKLDNLNMIQLIENKEMQEGILRVTYNKGKEKEIDLNVEKATEKN